MNTVSKSSFSLIAIEKRFPPSGLYAGKNLWWLSCNEEAKKFNRKERKKRNWSVGFSTRSGKFC
jgi:hypothetical protein